MARTFSPADAKRFYDRFGARQDHQGWYEDRAVTALIGAARFEAAQRVGEFGCGTGRLAARLMNERLPADARYLALDISQTMVALAQENLSPWPERALVVRTGGQMALPVGSGVLDRLIAAYVLDLLSEADIAAFIAEARRVLMPGGLLGLVSLTCPERGAARLVAKLWAGVRALKPSLVGGCRPLSLAKALDAADWDIQFRKTIVQWLVPSEVIVAARR